MCYFSTAIYASASRGAACVLADKYEAERFEKYMCAFHLFLLYARLPSFLHEQN